MAWLISTVFVAAGVALGGVFAFAWTAMARKALAGRIEMWRLGAEAGPSTRDREIAGRHHINEASVERWVSPVVFWSFRIFLPVFGGLCGLALAGNAGGLK